MNRAAAGRTRHASPEPDAQGSPLGSEAPLRRGLRRLSGQAGVDDDLDVVAHLQRAHERRVGLDAELALDERHRPGDAAVLAEGELEGDWPARRADAQLALDV